MLYFKHHSNMRHDVKLKRVISKYGLEGYGLYNLVLESITESLSTDSPIPDLQENCEDIAEFYNGNTAKINEMMNYMVNQGLFDLDDFSGHVLCAKLYKFLDTSQTRSEELRKMIKAYKKNASLFIESNYDESQTVSDKSDRKEENRIEIEENNKEKIYKKETRFSKPTIEEISEYCKERNNTVDPERFFDHYESKGWVVGKSKMKDWKSAVRTWEKNNFQSEKKKIDNFKGEVNFEF